MDNITEMITSFNFKDLIGYRGAILIVTDSQYILSYTDNYGKGAHNIYIDKVLNYIFVNKEKDSSRKVIKSHMYTDNKHLYIYFYGFDNITYNQYKNFMQFYNDNEEILSYISNKYILKVGFYDKFENKYINTNSFDEIINFIKAHINKKHIECDNVNEIIIGIPTRKEIKK